MSAMNIFMLGHSNVGKTTYMASAYGALQRASHGFSLAARDNSVHRNLCRMADSIKKGQYPLPTDQRSSYEYTLKHNGTEFFPFTWTDYRGGALRSRRDTEEKRQLIADLKAADGILMFCDSHSILSGQASMSEIGIMTNLISTALREVERPMPLTIVLTKYDLVVPMNQSLTEATLKMPDALFEPISGLIDVVHASEYVSGSVIPVACGRRSVFTDLPVLFTLYHGIHFRRLYYHNLLNQLVEQAKQHGNRAWFGNDMWSAFIGEKSERDKMTEKLNHAKQTAALHDTLVDPVNALMELFRRHELLMF